MKEKCTIKEDIIEVFKAFRKEKGLSQDELACFLGTTQQYVSKLEGDKVNPGLDWTENALNKMGYGLTFEKINKNNIMEGLVKIPRKELERMLIGFYGEKHFYKNKLKLIKDYRRVERANIRDLKKCGSFEKWYLYTNRVI